MLYSLNVYRKCAVEMFFFFCRLNKQSLSILLHPSLKQVSKQLLLFCFLSLLWWLVQKFNHVERWIVNKKCHMQITGHKDCNWRLFSLSINLTIIFTVNRLIIYSNKCQKSGKNAHLNFPALNVMSSDCVLCPNSSPKAKPAILSTFLLEKWPKWLIYYQNSWRLIF